MSDPVHILIVEDLKTDFDLAQREIRKAVGECVFQQAETQKDFLDALKTFQPDVVVSDYKLPKFDGRKALDLTLKHVPLTPFIVWTGSLTEDVAVDCMKAGANNYIIKGNTKRLGPAVVHALGEKQLVMERKQIEIRYQALFEQSHDAIFILNFEGQILSTNQRASDMLGYEHDELLGLSVNELSADLKKTEEIQKKVLKGESIPVFESLLRNKDGNTVPVETNLELVCDARGKPLHIQSVMRDITARKRAEVELQQRTDDLALLNAINGAVLRGESLNAIIKLLARELKRIFSSMGSTIYMLAPDGQSLTMQYHDMPSTIVKKIERLIGGAIPLVRIPIREDGYFRKVLDSKRGMIASDADEIQTWMQEFTETDFLVPAARGAMRKLIPQIYKVLNIKSMIIVPLVSDGQAIGLMDVSSPNLFTKNDLERIENIVRQLTAAIQHQRAHEKLRSSEERFRQLANNIQEVFWITDADSGEELYISPAYQNVWGRADETILNDRNVFIDTILPEDRAMVLEKIETQRKGIQTEMEYRIKRPDGSIRWIWDRAFPIFDDADNVVRLAGIAADITERKQVEQALHRSEERFRQLVNVAPVGVAVHLKGKLVFVNAAGARLIGAYSPDELLGMTVMDFVHPNDRKYAVEALEHMLIGETGWYPREEEFIRLDGSTINVEVIAIPFNYMGQSAVQVVFMDITERKLAKDEVERHLAEMQALYENGLAVGRLLQPREIGERIIETFSNHLSWHHVAIRLLMDGSDELELVAFSLSHIQDGKKDDVMQGFSKVSKVGQGLSGWVVQTGKSVRTGTVNEYPQYVDVYSDIQSGLYMPLKIGERVTGVISVESEEPNAFSLQDERLLATLGNQAAVAFENARLYQLAQQEIVERKRMSKALRISETHYRELADSVTDIFFELDRELRYTHWNKASEMLTGIPSQHAVGKAMHEIFGESEEQTRIGKIYESVLASRKSRIFETLFMLNGEWRSFEVSAYPSTRGVSVMAKDVTDRKRSAVILQKRFELMDYSTHHSLEELMRMTADEASELTGSQFAFFHFVEPDQKTLGMQVWSMSTLNFFNVPVSVGEHLPLNQAGVWADAARERRSVIHNDYASLPNKKDLPDGHAGIVRQMVIPVIRNEKIVAVMGVANKATEYTQQDLETGERLADYAWDITERKQMETALADERNQLAQRVNERTSELIKANSNLARALRVKDEFLANMSHELRTPLNAILGLSESLGEQVAGPLNKKQLKYITTIGESGHHLLSLINDILDLAKIDAGQITLDINKVDVNGVCQASLRMVKQQAQKKNQKVLLNIESNIGLIRADERRLKQMLVNLLSNAVKFTPENGELGLDVKGFSDENRVEFSVWDNGIGISDEDLTRLFKPFVQLDSGLARESTGTGLGLALVSQMARLHGGSVKTTSEPGRGSRFTLLLPWEATLFRETLEKMKSTGKLSMSKTDTNIREKILLVEDTEEVIMMIRDYLEIAGFEVTVAEDGVDGLNQARLVHPDLILMDIQMPRMDGIEATQKLRDDPKFKYVPIIALTALAMPGDRERCLAAGMDEYISKPVNLRMLVKLIQKFLSITEERTRPV
ncbi:MAG TPA: PAS domain S-box protein [Anaerolineales bacterium]|nr:PAS domain S-box protein [Anaerolineales bacterium]